MLSRLLLDTLFLEHFGMKFDGSLVPGFYANIADFVFVFHQTKTDLCVSLPTHREAFET